MTTELAVIDAEVRVLALEPVSDNRTALARYVQLQDFVRAVMRKGEDFGDIPGVAKPTLFKAGAEKLAEMYGLAITLPDARRRSIENWEQGFWHYEVVCSLVSRRTGEVVAEGVGSCNSMEDRYRTKEWWNTPNQPSASEGWMPTRNGKWFRFIENPTRWNLPNTLLKMAKKRALVDAVLSVTRSSGIFTQDVEDMPMVADQAEPPPRSRPTAQRQPANGQSARTAPDGPKQPPRTHVQTQEAEALLEHFKDQFEDAATQDDMRAIKEELKAPWGSFTQAEQRQLVGWEGEAWKRINEGPGADLTDDEAMS